MLAERQYVNKYNTLLMKLSLTIVFLQNTCLVANDTALSVTQRCSIFPGGCSMPWSEIFRAQMLITARIDQHQLDRPRVQDLTPVDVTLNSVSGDVSASCCRTTVTVAPVSGAVTWLTFPLASPSLYLW